MNKLKERLGLACGDAVGTTLEFSPRDIHAPQTDMIGGGPFHLKPGQWTDDTSMALCLAESLVSRQGFDPLDQMERYCDWRDNGYLSSTGACFDIGMTVNRALELFRQDGEPFSGSTHPRSAGNGSIMRLAPVPMFYSPDPAEVIHYSGESSRTTHGADECIDACKLFGLMLHVALLGGSRDEILNQSHYSPITAKIQAIANGSYQKRARHEIKGTGYVVQSLEAALWCFYHTDTYRAAILMATNLADDADTTAAVCGQIAGAYYGLEGIPRSWLEQVALRQTIEKLALALMRP